MKLLVGLLCLSLAVVASAKEGGSSKAKKAPSVFRLHATSKIFTRFATTTVNSSILNPADKSQEVAFSVQLPNAAFISNFSMLIGGKIIVGDVKDKAAAKKQYETAKALGQTAGFVAQNARETNKFDISINVEPYKTAQFQLEYQEVLQRVQGTYKHVININPKQIVDDFVIIVEVVEKRNITYFKVIQPEAKLSDKSNKELRKKRDATDVNIDESKTEKDYSKIITTFSPDQTEQRKYSTNGLNGMQFVVLYDVERDYSSGEVEVVNGFFVHFIAPTGDELPVGNKDIVFVLDISGSMGGTKIRQLRESMKLILNDLNKNDLFNIVTFATDVFIEWPESIEANDENKIKAIQFVSTLRATSSTNIYGALDTGIRILKKNKSHSTLASVIVFLTDGQASANITSSDGILGGVNSWNSESQFSIHSISFGNNADFNLLQRISTQNRGIARKVYEDSDATLQLVGFYDEISSPLITNLDISYLNETVDPNSVVQDIDYTYYKGGEVVVVGQLNPDYQIVSGSQPNFQGEVSGTSVNGPVAFRCWVPVPCIDWCPIPVLRPTPCFISPLESGSAEATNQSDPSLDQVRPNYCHHDVIYDPPYCRDPCLPPIPRTTPKPVQDLPTSSYGGFVERMWAYLTIKKLLKKSKFEAVTEEEKKSLNDKALYLSLKYKFVTELTSMVVTKSSEKEHEMPSEGEAEKSTKNKLGSTVAALSLSAASGGSVSGNVVSTTGGGGGTGVGGSGTGVGGSGTGVGGGGTGGTSGGGSRGRGGGRLFCCGGGAAGPTTSGRRTLGGLGGSSFAGAVPSGSHGISNTAGASSRSFPAAAPNPQPNFITAQFLAPPPSLPAPQSKPLQPVGPSKCILPSVTKESLLQLAIATFFATSAMPPLTMATTETPSTTVPTTTTTSTTTTVTTTTKPATTTTEMPTSTISTTTTTPGPTYEKTSNMSIFTFTKNYLNTTAESEEKCAEKCFYSGTCTMAGYYPAAKKDDHNICAMSFQTVDDCQIDNSDEVKTSGPIVLYCLNL